jgi:dTDP-4-amino-4,6-dideoxygalactose transaminase
MPTHFAGRKSSVKGKVIDSCHRIEKDDVIGSDAFWCYSFYATKNMSTVQGGMIALNSEEDYKWFLMARDHGTTKGTAQRYKGNNPLYDVSFVGWRVKGDDLRASIGIEQLKKLPKLTKLRNEIVSRYNDNLGLNRAGNHLYFILVNDRARFIREMFDRGVQCSIHFRPIHTLTAFKKYATKLPNTDYIAEKIVSIPMFPGMTKKEVDYVCKCIKETNLLIM